MRNERAVGNRRQKEPEERWKTGGNRKGKGSDFFLRFLNCANPKQAFSPSIQVIYITRQFLFLFPIQNPQLQKSCEEFFFLNHKIGMCKTHVNKKKPKITNCSGSAKREVWLPDKTTKVKRFFNIFSSLFPTQTVGETEACRLSGVSKRLLSKSHS